VRELHYIFINWKEKNNKKWGEYAAFAEKPGICGPAACAGKGSVQSAWATGVFVKVAREGDF